MRGVGWVVRFLTTNLTNLTNNKPRLPGSSRSELSGTHFSIRAAAIPDGPLRVSPG
jgi:hypothetical protein